TIYSRTVFESRPSTLTAPIIVPTLASFFTSKRYSFDVNSTASFGFSVVVVSSLCFSSSFISPTSFPLVFTVLTSNSFSVVDSLVFSVTSSMFS
ncbi:hypothetical protein PFISCL1PPCAC_14640, partial [Pristionchus fissidentatus]